MRSLYLFIIFSTILWSCGPSGTCHKTGNIKFMDAKAEINLNLSLDLDQLTIFTDNLIPDTIFSGDMEGEDIEVLVKKNGFPALVLDDKSATITLPLDVYAKKDLGFIKATAEGSLFITLKSTIDIAEDWSWKTKTEIVKIEWQKDPQLKVLGIRISVKSMIDNYLESSEKDLTDKIDEAVASNPILKNTIAKAQSIFERAYPLDSDGNFFIQVLPELAGLSPFDKEGKRLFTNITLDAKAILINDSLATITVVDTPRFQWSKPSEFDNSMSAFITLPESDIQNIVRQSTIDQKFDFRGKNVTVDQVFLSFQGGKIKTDVHFSGGLVGDVHFEGKPIWDDDDHEVDFCQTDIELNIRRGIPKFLLWIGKGAIKRKMVDELEDKINQEIEDRLKELNKQLSDYNLGKGVRVKADIYNVLIDPLIIEDKSLKLGIHLDVRGMMMINELQLRIE